MLSFICGLIVLMLLVCVFDAATGLGVVFVIGAGFVVGAWTAFLGGTVFCRLVVACSVVCDGNKIKSNKHIRIGDSFFRLSLLCGPSVCNSCFSLLFYRGNRSVISFVSTVSMLKYKG